MTAIAGREGSHFAEYLGDFCELAFARVGLHWQKDVVSQPELHRPPEVFTLVGND